MERLLGASGGGASEDHSRARSWMTESRVKERQGFLGHLSVNVFARDALVFDTERRRHNPSRDSAFRQEGVVAHAGESIET